MKVISYLRVSTDRQGRSGLGLEAQAKAIEDYVKRKGASVLASYVEVESGKAQHNRPELAKALQHAKLTGATLVIAKLDRLSRNAAFLLALIDAGGAFVAADLPEANHLTVGIMALVAQQEREAISRRTKEALAAAKARGVKLGNPQGAAALRRAGKGNVSSVEAIKAKADRFAEELAPVLGELRRGGVTSLGGIAQALNERGILTPRGKSWHKAQVRALLDRVA
jgi:DNA invertase Pin-like site-specific DNA recombinase